MPEVKNDITITFNKEKAALRGIITYNKLLFAKETIEQFAKHFSNALRMCVTNTNQPICEMEIGLENAVYRAADFSAHIISSTSQGKIAPLSHAQQRLWFISLFSPDSPVYNIPGALVLTGRIKEAALAQSLREITRRHEILRTTFPTVEGQAVQLIAPEAELPLEVIELHEFGGEEAQREFGRLATEQAQIRFDLENGPVWRVWIVRLGEGETGLLVTMHHIISDGWSNNIFFQELMALYSAIAEGKESPLKELPIQYADYAARQREWMTGEVLDNQLAYWKNQLQGAPSILELPTDRSRPSIRTFTSNKVSFKLSKQVSADIKKQSRQEGATLYMSLLAAFQVLLYRWSGQEDLCVGSPIAGRTRTETEGLIGCFLNVLVMRSRLAGDPSFREVVRMVRETALGAFANQELPFERLVEEMQPERSLSHSPVVQVTFTLLNMPRKAQTTTGAKARFFEVDSGTVEYDLSLLVMAEGEAFSGSIVYNSDLFEQRTIERVISHFNRLLEGVVKDANQPISAIDLLSPQERGQILNEWNDTKREYPSESSIHKLFEQQANRAPDQLAVVFEGEQISYQEVNRRANQLGNYLRELGVGPEVMVGIMMDRGIEMIVSMLAILKAGGAYVPIDEQYPMERIAFQIEDAAIGIVVTKKEYAGKVPALMVQVVEVDEQCDEISNRGEHNLEVEAAADNLAYVIYTSGSTGNPKGVEIQHRSVIRLVKGAEYVKLDEQETLLQASTLSFDAATFEIWGALLNGAKLVVLQSRLATGHELSTIIAEQAVSTLWLTSSLYNAIADERVEYLQGLKQLLVGGEALSVKHIREGVRRLKGLSMINGYGPTEGTTFTCCHQIGEADVEEGRQRVAIGTGITNTFVYVLDKRMEIAPIGVAGELYIGGDGLARGYLNRPELTAEKFIPNPFCKEAGHRLYRTGDICRWNADGKIDYIARSDFQVKVRGYRIELGEIEATLEKEARVRQAVVVLKQDAADKRLIGYVVMQEGERVTSSELRSYLKERLPDYMIPGVISVIEEIPITSSGKADRRALCAMPRAQAEIAERFVSPRNEIEKILAGVWEEALRVQSVGVFDNFFELGGDSIRSIQVISRAREQGLTLTIQDLFQFQTIDELAGKVKKAEGVINRRESEFSLIGEEDRVLLPKDIEDAYPLSQLQAGMIYHSEMEPETSVYHDIISYQVEATFREQEMRASLEGAVKRHGVLRTSFDVASYSQPLQLVSKEVPLPLEVIDVRGRSETEQRQELKRWIGEEKRRGIEWNKAPLMRLCIHWKDDEKFQMTISFHHAIMDGWSQASLLNELFREYWHRLGREGGGIAEAPRIGYREFIRLEREAIESEECKRYWGGVIKGIERKKKAADAKGRKVGIKRIRIREQVFEQLKDLASELGVPVKSVLLAAHMRVMGLLSGDEEVVTGVVTNGRPEERDAERVLGLFLNTAPMRMRMGGGTWSELIGQAYEAEKHMLPHRRYPLAELQKATPGEAFFDTAFGVLHFHVLEGIRELGGMSISSSEEVIETNYALGVGFGMDLNRKHLSVDLRVDEQEYGGNGVERIIRYYENSLERMIENPNERYEEASLLSEDEIAQILHQWNETERGYADNICVHELFEQRAQEMPEAIAVVHNHQMITYEDLNRRANQLAHYLRRKGAGPESLVAICVREKHRNG